MSCARCAAATSSTRDGQLLVHVASGKGGLERDVPVLAGREADVLAMSEGRDPEALVFARIPETLRRA